MTTREMKVTERYLHLPVKNGAPLRRMRFLVEGSVEREFDIELAEGRPTSGSLATFRLSRESGCASRGGASGWTDALAALRQAPGAGRRHDHRERYRPQFHFLPGEAGTTTPTAWSTTGASITSSSSTIPTGASGATCTGGTR